MELISWHHNNLLVGYFGINKIIELIGQKYYYLDLKKDVKVYIKGYNIYLLFKMIRHKPYGKL